MVCVCPLGKAAAMREGSPATWRSLATRSWPSHGVGYIAGIHVTAQLCSWVPAPACQPLGWGHPGDVLPTRTQVPADTSRAEACCPHRVLPKLPHCEQINRMADVLSHNLGNTLMQQQVTDTVVRLANGFGGDFYP